MDRRSWITLVIAFILADLAVVAWILYRQGTITGQGTLWVFVFALGALIPLAQLIGEATERLTKFLSPFTGGLINASLSNVPELAIGIFLLVHAYLHAASVDIDFEVIRGLLIGSVINNVLLTLGLSVFVGAIKNGPMRFEAERAAGYASMLALAVVGLALPKLATSFAAHPTDAAQIQVSLLVGGILIITYVVYIGTSIFNWGEKALPQPAGLAAKELGETHREARHEREEARDLERERMEEAERKKELARAEEHKEHQQRRRENHGEFVGAILLLALATVVTVAMAGVLVSVTDNVIRDTPLTPLSTGLILFPIVCNLDEAASALSSARRGRIGDAMEVAAGSSVQIPLFVTPLLVFVSFFFALIVGNSHLVLTLIFTPLELIVVGLVTFVYALVNLDGETTWLEGVQLLAFYAMIAVVAFALPGQ